MCLVNSLSTAWKFCYETIQSEGERYFQTGSDTCVRIVQFDTFENLNCSGQKCSKYTWTSPAGKTCRKTDYSLVVTLTGQNLNSHWFWDANDTTIYLHSASLKLSLSRCSWALRDVGVGERMPAVGNRVQGDSVLGNWAIWKLQNLIGLTSETCLHVWRIMIIVWTSEYGLRKILQDVKTHPTTSCYEFKQHKLCVIAGFRGGADEICAILGYYAV